MIIQIIEKKISEKRSFGINLIDYTYGAVQGDKVAVGNTMIEAISKCMGLLEKPITVSFRRRYLGDF